jgi:hypothetical protein
MGCQSKRLRHECFIADVNVSESGRDGAMSRRDKRFQHERFIADVNVLGSANAARWAARRRIQHGCFIADVNVLRPAAATRWVTVATGSMRTLHRGCQRIETGLRRRDESP